jgi:hypothetical protein
MRICDLFSIVSSGSGRAATCRTGRYPSALRRHAGIAVPGLQNTMKRPESIHLQSPQRSQPLWRAAVCEEFLRLRDREHFTVTGAARAIGLSASSFSGKGSMLCRYLRGGLAGLERPGGSGAGACHLSRRIEELGWFIPAAQFCYLAAYRRRGSLVAAIHHAAALPNLPRGWRQETHARFLSRLNLEAAPECPEELRAELLTRERQNRQIVPERIMRQIKASPSSIRQYSIEMPVGELSQIPFTAMARRMAELEPGATCRLSMDLV